GNVIVGSVAGFGLAAKVLNCDVTGGNITVTGNNYFSYAGGVVGILQSAMTGGSQQDSETGETYEVVTPYYAVINSVHTSVDIVRTSEDGYVYGAGGIAAMVISYNQVSPAYITNCYSESRVFGAIRVGGIAGSLNDNSAIMNCYSTGEYEANSKTSNDIADYDAMAGGLVGYAGLNTAIVNSFSTAEVYAESVNGDNHAWKDGLAAVKATSTSTHNSAVVYNCYYGNEAKGIQLSFVYGTLNWSPAEWDITDGALPTLTDGLALNRVYTVTVNYGGLTVDGNTSREIGITANNYFLPIIDYFRYSNDGFDETFISDDNKTSYGYFFDSGLTHRVPYGYAPVRDVTLYVGFADYTGIAGNNESGKTYYYLNNGRTVELTLYNWGEFVYTDGVKILSTYTYDGEKIIFADAPFARLSKVVLENSNDRKDPSLNYEKYYFASAVEEDGLRIYDDSYFAKDSITFLSVKPSTQTDAFKGEWEKSATINKIYSFDGNGNWTYSYKGETVSGEYSIANGKAVMTVVGGAYAEAVIDASGLIAVTKTGKDTEYFGLKGGLLGTWFDTNTGNYVIFNGYGNTLSGQVIVNVGGNVSQLMYIKDGFFDDYSEGDSNGYSLTIISPTTAALFGYLNYNKDTAVLSGALYSGLTGEIASGNSFRLVDNYSGEWIGEGSVNGVDFTLMNFNGFGTYSVKSPADITTSLGFVEINGSVERIEYTVDINGGLIGTFTYNNIVYSLSFDDENGEVVVSDGSA
ncbi:MAG: hypothetical protein K2K80_01845, partial [Clostridia bacterium]|nr:hypothetical protein [Clostridia bacterium]